VKFKQMIKQMDEFLPFYLHFGGGVFDGRWK
jgi:hypothetical protein